jgi:hypothetical protein
MGQPYPVVPPPVPPAGRERLPRTVLVAGLLTILGSIAALGLSLLLFAIVLVGSSDSAFGGDGLDPSNRAMLTGLVVWSVVGIVLGTAVMRRSSIARILLVVSSVGVVGLSLSSIGNVLMLVWATDAVLVVVLLFTGGANAWFARRPAS